MTQDREDAQPRSTAEIAYGRESDEATDTNGTQRDVDGTQRDGAVANATTEEQHAPLISTDKSTGYSGRWQNVQAEFVDEPQKAVRDADVLVAEVIQTLATTFADQRKTLEEQWSKGSEVSTEDLRQALMQYRSFFQRLLAA
jgi:hypothetical protein